VCPNRVPDRSIGGYEDLPIGGHQRLPGGSHLVTESGRLERSDSEGAAFAAVAIWRPRSQSTDRILRVHSGRPERHLGGASEPNRARDIGRGVTQPRGIDRDCVLAGEDAVGCARAGWVAWLVTGGLCVHRLPPPLKEEQVRNGAREPVLCLSGLG
jgi:hypothetical protein